MRVRNKSRYYEAVKYEAGMEDGFTKVIINEDGYEELTPYILVGNFKDYGLEGFWILTDENGNRHKVSEEFFKMEYEEVEDISKNQMKVSVECPNCKYDLEYEFSHVGIKEVECPNPRCKKWFSVILSVEAIDFSKPLDKGNVSDGYHTFNELYYHRMILFSIICNQNKNKAWKSWLHSDGTMFEDYFIVGISTPEGDYSYHYHKDYWDMFKVHEFRTGPVWDGHKPEDVDRLLSLLE